MWGSATQCRAAPLSLGTRRGGAAGAERAASCGLRARDKPDLVVPAAEAAAPLAVHCALLEVGKVEWRKPEEGQAQA